MLQPRWWLDGRRLLHQEHPGFRQGLRIDACRTVLLRLELQRLIE